MRGRELGGEQGGFEVDLGLGAADEGGGKHRKNFVNIINEWIGFGNEQKR